jgi:poly(hydroxyalkanoate) granule-associated protein
MVTRTKDTAGGETGGAPAPDFSSTVKDSAQQIWLAGLGAFAKAQEEGSKVFDTLVKEGVSMQRKTQASAGEKLSEAGSKMASMATEITSRASGQWDKLETIFEDRVSKALRHLGVPTSADVDALNARIDELTRAMARSARSAPAKGARSATAKSAAARGGAGPAAKRKPARKSD